MRKLLDTTRLLRKAQTEMHDNPEFANAVAKEFGSINVQKVLDDNHLMVQKRLTSAIHQQHSAQAKVLQLEEKNATLRGKQALDVASANNQYQQQLSLMNQLHNKKVVSTSQLKTQLKTYQDMQVQYQRMLQMDNRAERKGARDAFIKQFSVDGFRDMPHIQGRIQALQTEINNRIRGTHTTLGQVITQSQNLHGVWRGMTAAVGQIWLSWGNFLPLMAGLAPMLATMKAINSERAFGWQMAQVGAAAEVGDKAVKQLGEGILALGGGHYTQSPLQMAEALRVLAQAGLNTKDAFATLPSVLNLAMVAGTTDEEAALFTAGLRYPFQLFDQKSIQAGIDQTAKAANVSQTSIQSMMESMKQAAPAAAKFGMSLSDVSTVLAALARVNIVGSAAGTAFKNLMTDLAGRTEKGRKALEALGLSAFDSAGMVKPLTQVIAELQDKFQGMNDRDKQKWMKSFLDERGMRAADVLLNMTTQDFRKLHEEISRGAENMGYTSVQAERLGNTSEGAFRKMKAAWETTFVRIGESSADPFKGLLGSLTNLANDPAVIGGLTSVATGLTWLAGAGVQAASAVAPLLPLVNGLVAGAGVMGIATLAGMAKGLMSAAMASSFMTTVMVASVGQTGLLAVAASRATAALGLMRAALLANPWGAAALAIGGVVAYLSIARRETTTFAQELRKLPQDLGAVKTEIYEAFNKFDGVKSSGIGGRMDWLLGIQGDILLDLKRGNKEASDRFVLDWSNSFDSFASNLTKIREVTQQEMRTLSGSLKDSLTANLDEMGQLSQAASQAELEQATMLTERKKSLLETQLTNLDKHLAGVGELSKQDKDLRQQYEQDIYDTAVRLMTLRTQLASQQLTDLRVQAINEMGVLESFWDSLKNSFTDMGKHRSLMIRQANMLEQGMSEKAVAELTDSSMEQVGQAAQLLAAKTQQGTRPEAEYFRLFGSDWTMDKVHAWNNQNNNATIRQANSAALQANPQTAAAKITNDLKQLQALYNRQKDLGTLTKANADAIETQRKILQARLNEAHKLLTQSERDKAESSRTNLAERRKSNMGGVVDENGNPISPSSVGRRGKAGGATGGGVSSRTTYKTITPYESTIQSEYAEEMAKMAQEQAKNALERQKSIMGYATDDVVRAYTDTLDQAWKSKAAKIRDEARKKANTIREKIAKGDIAQADMSKALADLDLLSQRIRDYSPAGQVDLGASYRKAVSTTKVAGFGTAQSTQVVSQSAAKAADYAIRHAAAESLKRCAEFVNNAFQAQGLKAWGHGWQVARNLINANKGKFASVKYDESYVPQIGDVMSMKSPRHEHGHAAIYTAQGWVSDFKQGKGMGNTGAANAKDYAAIKAGRITPEIARPIGGSAVSGSLKSTATNVKGETTQTYETVAVQAQKISDVNQQDGQGLKRLQEQTALEQQRVQIQEQSRREIQTIMVERQREFELQSQSLEAQKSMGLLTEAEYFAQSQALQARKLYHENEMAILQIKQNTGASEDEIGRKVKEQNDLLEYQLELLGKRAQTNEQSKQAMTGITAAFNSAADEAVNYAAYAKKQTDILIGGIGSAFEQMALKGKVNFRELTVSILQDLAKVYARMAAMQLIKSLGQAFGIIASARGNVFDGGSLRAYASGGIVNSPTYFGFNGGRGLMGEAGAEAIMPLQRMANGDLGVTVKGGGMGGAVINAPVQVSVVVNSDGSSNSDVSGSQAKQMGEAVAQVVVVEVQKMLRPNGLINSAIKSGGAA